MGFPACFCFFIFFKSVFILKKFDIFMIMK
jgi:hypothetical protein